MHFLSSILAVSVPLQLAVAAADAQITAAAVLEPRQNADPSLVGWVSTSGQSTFSVDRSCDYPATLSKSGSYAQCCATTGPCNFYTSCSNGNLLAASTSVFCDQGNCNTGVIIASVGAAGGQSFLGCWPTDYGSAAFSLVQNIGTAPVATPSDGASRISSTTGAGAMTSGGSSSTSSGASAAATTSTNTGSSNGGTTTSSTSPSSTTHGNAASGFAASSLGLLGAAAFALILL